MNSRLKTTHGYVVRQSQQSSKEFLEILPLTDETEMECFEENLKDPDFWTRAVS